MGSIFTQARNKVSEMLTSQLHDGSRLHSWYLQSSSVQGENDRFASSRAAVNKVVKSIQTVTVATISGRIEFGSLNSGVPPGRGVTVPSGGDSAMVLCLLLCRGILFGLSSQHTKIGRSCVCYWTILLR